MPYLIKDLEKLVAVPSIRDLNTKKEDAPFGENISKAFDEFLTIAQREGFRTEDFNGYAAHAEIGSGDEFIGVLGHLDVVPIFNPDQWHSDPFKMTERDGFLYGRGVNDDKGPILAALYSVKILKELNLDMKRRVRIIVGGAEETTWECMKYYFSKNPQPVYGFSPDGDFPIVNGEKGIIYYSYRLNEATKDDNKHNLAKVCSKDEDGFVCDFIEAEFITKDEKELKSLLKRASSVESKDNKVRVTYEGKRALSRHPERGENAAFKFGKDLCEIRELNSKGKALRNILEKYFIDSIYGENIGLNVDDKEMGNTTMCLMNLFFREEDFCIKFDFRYPKGIKKEKVKDTFKRIADENGLVYEITKELDMLYVSPESELISSLKAAYKEVMGEEAELISKGAASYARTLKEGVAFGPTLMGDVPNSHKANENIKIETLEKAIEIYCNAIYLLACR